MKLCHFFFVLISVYSCSGTASKSRQLDFFGEFENTEVTFLLKGEIDSINFGIDYFQYLHPRYRFDTTVMKANESTMITKQLSIEKPTIVDISINGTLNKTFLLPGESTTIEYNISPEEVVVSYENKELRRFNDYFDRKESLVGGLHFRDFYAPQILKSDVTFEQILVGFDSIKLLQNNLLNKCTEELGLPDWFVQYEKKSILYRDKSARLIAPVVREYLGVSDQRVPYSVPIDQDNVLNDEEGLLNEDYLPVVSQYIQEGFYHMEYRQLSRHEQAWLKYRWGKNIPNQKIKDVYYAHNYLIMQQSSFAYEDTLVNQFRQAISADLQPYIDRLDRNFASLEGKPAPGIHLKDANDQLVSLRDYRGNIILLDFWFIGCPGCKEEFPHDRKLVNTFKNEPFKFIKICMKSDKVQWKNMQNELSGINLISNEAWDKKLTKTYQLKGYPRYVLIDKAGKIIDGWSERPSDPSLTDRLQHYFR